MTEDETFAALRRITLQEIDILVSQSIIDNQGNMNKYYNNVHSLVLENGWTPDEYREYGRYYIDIFDLRKAINRGQ